MEDTVAVFGLGNMGYPVAARVAKVFDTLVSDLDRNRADAAAEEFGARPFYGPQDVNQAQFIVLCLPNPKASLEVLKQIRPHLRESAIVIETSTVNPEHVRQSARELDGSGACLIDASILAGVSQMEAGTATLLLGGDESAITEASGVLEAIATRQISFGELGAGAAAKVINNAVAHAVMVVVCEAGSMAVASGVDVDKLVGLLSDEEMGLHRPLTFRYAKRIAEGNFDGGMPLAAARKDSELALQLAQTNGVPLFAIQGSHTPYEIGVGDGHGQEDYAAIARLWEKWGKPTVPWKE